MLLQLFESEESLDRTAAVHPIGRIGRPEEIANSVVWLFSDNSSYYTGQSLTLDGDLTPQRPFPEMRNIHGRQTTEEKTPEWRGAIPSSQLPGSAPVAFGNREFAAGD